MKKVAIKNKNQVPGTELTLAMIMAPLKHIESSMSDYSRYSSVMWEDIRRMQTDINRIEGLLRDNLPQKTKKIKN
jgi:hypothetical protein